MVNEDDTAGALVGAVLARGFFGPLLVSPPDKLTKNLKDEVQRVRPRGVYVIGDEELLAGKVLSDLTATGVPPPGSSKARSWARWVSVPEPGRGLPSPAPGS